MMFLKQLRNAVTFDRWGRWECNNDLPDLAIVVRDSIGVVHHVDLEDIKICRELGGQRAIVLKVDGVIIE